MSILRDPIYGAVALDAPLLRDLYHSEAVQRLGDVYQGGITAFIKPERRTTRLEHSVGVMTLLQRLGAGVEEQAAGLIHDAPHTAFSHVVDFVFPNCDHTYHEVHREEFIAASDLPAILERHDIAWRWLAEAENFSLLEQPLPALCADRLDYFLRDGLSLGRLMPSAVADFLEHLRVWEGRIVVAGLPSARWLGERFIVLDEMVWCAVQEVGWYAIMARALLAALAAGVITEADFWGIDHPLMARLRASRDPEVQRWLALLRPDVDFVRVDDDSADLLVLPKVRAVDPPVWLDGQVRPLSQLDADFARLRARYVAGKQGSWGLRIVDGATTHDLRGLRNGAF